MTNTQTPADLIDEKHWDRAYELIVTGAENVASTLATEFGISAIEAERVETFTQKHPIVRAALAYNSR